MYRGASSTNLRAIQRLTEPLGQHGPAEAKGSMTIHTELATFDACQDSYGNVARYSNSQAPTMLCCPCWMKHGTLCTAVHEMCFFSAILGLSVSLIQLSMEPLSAHHSRCWQELQVNALATTCPDSPRRLQSCQTITSFHRTLPFAPKIDFVCRAVSEVDERLEV